MKKITTLMVILLVALSTISWAQIEITGTVTDETGMPLPGANVLLVGTSRGVVSDFDGNFAIQAAEGDVLEISYVGMVTQQVTIGTETKLNITLQSDASALDEVVVVGYGTQKRKDVTGAIASIKSEGFNKGVVANAGQLLQGKVAGVNITAASGEPGAAQDVIIRGVGSLRSGTTPLYVVDGFALDNTGIGVSTNPLNFINPQDIESIDVLKDASAAAIYGSRAANGVIVITTKKGKQGKTQMNLSVSTAFSNLSNEVDVFGADEFRTQVNAINGVLNDGGGSTNWQDELTRTAVSKNINFSMSGGTENSSYAASLGLDDQEGIFRNSNLKRYSGRLNLTQRGLKDKLKVEFNFTGSKIDNTRPDTNGIINNMLSMNPTDPVYTNGELTSDLSNDVVNPLVSERLYGDFADNYRILANIAPSLEIIDGLTYRINIGVDYSMTNRDIQLRPYATETFITLGSLNSSTTKNQNTLVENTLTYNYTKDLHNFTLLGGHSYQETEVYQKVFNLSGFPDNGVEPRYQIETASEPTLQSAYAIRNELQSFFGRLNYAYDSRYLLTATIRADGSSKFGGNNRYGYFPSFALGWNITNEEFMTSSESINNLKLRASWGQTGSQEIPAKITKASYTESITNNDTYPLLSGANDISAYPYGTIYTRLANPDIQWEVSTQFNVGLDFSLFNNRLSGTIDYFNKVSENILLEVTPTDPIQPTDRYWTNIPDMEIKNNGLEMALDYQSDQSGDFSYNIGGNFSIIKNEVVNSPYQILTTGAAQGAGQTGATINGVLNGEAIGAFYMLEFDGIGSDGLNQFNDRNGDGEILDDDRYVAGNALPDFIYSFFLNFNYKKFDLGLNFNGVSGNKIYNHVAMSLFNRGNLANSFNTTNRAIEYPNESASNSNTVSDRYLEDGGYLRLNNATLGYSLDPNVLGIGDMVNNIRLTITGQNLFTISDYSGFDPELNTGIPTNDIKTYGIDYYSYPRNRTVLFGLNVAF
ncbi:SusC/RagA family TonB-linked outer membrane protein [Aestuariivivens sediminis]|uniref:SusC/RagA family TonB-linked outer membrane protein n=1 Tax=Aestuariivivens sediminis TaxID=2913557 RepID=UPI001F57B883|nr:TonB-dependent receptor [Aestuariivivens sediminis]